MGILSILGGVAGIGGLGFAAFLIGPQKILTFVMANWKAVLLGAVVLLAFLYVRHLQNEAKGARADSARWQGLFRQEKAAFLTEKASLDGARAQIDDYNRRVEAAGQKLVAMTQEVAANDARNAKLARTTDAQIAGLKRAAGLHQKPCVLSAEAKMELGQ